MWGNPVVHEVGKGYGLPLLQPRAHVLCYNFTLTSSPRTDHDQPLKKDHWACSREVSEVPLPVLQSLSFTASCRLVASSLNKGFLEVDSVLLQQQDSANFHTGIRQQSPPWNCGALDWFGRQGYHLERCQAAGHAGFLYLIHCFDVARFNHEGVSFLIFLIQINQLYNDYVLKIVQLFVIHILSSHHRLFMIWALQLSANCVCLSIYLSIYLPTYLSSSISIYITPCIDYKLCII